MADHATSLSNNDGSFWSSEWVRSQMPTDQEVAQSTTPYANQAVQDALTGLAQRMGIRRPVLENLSSFSENGNGESYETREGTPHIALNPSLSTQDAIAVATHEAGHIRNRDTSPEAIAVRHNSGNTDAAFAMERRADSNAVEQCQGNQYADILERDYDPTFVDTAHPDIKERVNFLRQGAGIEEEAGRCTAPALENKLSDAHPFAGMVNMADIASFGQITGGEDVQTYSAPTMTADISRDGADIGLFA